MGEKRIQIEPFHIQNLLTYHSLRYENEHGKVMLSGIIAKEHTEEYIQLLQGNVWVSISLQEEEETYNLFRGIVTEGDMRQEGGCSILSLTLYTGTILLDTVRHTRSFQDSALTYKDIIRHILGQYENGNMIMTSENGAGGFMMQYRETDWTFFKRIASCMHTVLMADARTGGSKFFCGVPQKGVAGEIQTGFYRVTKRLHEFGKRKAWGVTGIREDDFTYYRVKTKELYELGDRIIFNGVPVHICGVESRMEGSELYHTYDMKRPGGFRVPKLYNEALTGVSLTGYVTEVSGTRICISLEADENQAECGRTWFDFSTPYSSYDGAGFYCMPEIGDTVRLYFPTCDEKTACGFSAVNREERQNPEIKYLMNKEDKQLILAPDYIRLTNNAGMSLELNDHAGIRIESSGSVSVQAGGNLDIVSKHGKVTLSAAGKVVLEQGKTTMNLAGDIHLKGASVKIN